MRCDGLVAATPAGSTGYNLANQGPILAWGVEGYVVSFIAPHTLTARALVVAPDDVLHVSNAAGREAVDVVLDGEHVGELRSGEEIEVRFRDRRRAAGAAPRLQLLPPHPREVRAPGPLSGRRGPTTTRRRLRGGAEVVDAGSRLRCDLHVAARHHGRQRRPPGHPEGPRRQPLQPPVGSRCLLADPGGLPAHGGLARRPDRAPPVFTSASPSSPSPPSCAGSQATRRCSTSPEGSRVSAGRRCSPPRWR